MENATDEQTAKTDDFAQFKVAAQPGNDDFSGFKVADSPPDHENVLSRAWNFLTTPLASEKTFYAPRNEMERAANAAKTGEMPPIQRTPTGPDEFLRGSTSPLSLATSAAGLEGPEASFATKVATRVPLTVTSGLNTLSGLRDVTTGHPWRGAAEIGLGLLGLHSATPEFGSGAPGALGKLAAKDAFSRIPVLGRLVNRPSVLDYLRASQTERPTFYNRAAGPNLESGNFSPIEGEYVDTQPPVKGNDIPRIHAELNPRQLPESGSPAMNMPYRFGPGDIPAEDVALDERTLSGNKGLRLTPRFELPSVTDSAAMDVLQQAEPKGSPLRLSEVRRAMEETGGKPGYALQKLEGRGRVSLPKTRLEDQEMTERMQEDLERQHQAGIREHLRPTDIPKGTPYIPPEVGLHYGIGRYQAPPVELPMTLEDQLRESLRLAREKRQ